MDDETKHEQAAREVYAKRPLRCPYDAVEYSENSGDNDAMEIDHRCVLKSHYDGETRATAKTRALAENSTLSYEFVYHQLLPSTVRVPCICGYIFASPGRAIYHKTFECAGKPLIYPEWVQRFLGISPDKKKKILKHRFHGADSDLEHVAILDSMSTISEKVHSGTPLVVAIDRYISGPPKADAEIAAHDIRDGFHPCLGEIVRRYEVSHQTGDC